MPTLVYKIEPEAETILILAPTGQDAHLLSDVLARDGIRASVFQNVDSLTERARADYGALLFAEEALTRTTITRLQEILRAQEPWSDVPLIVMTTGGETTLASFRIMKELSPAGNVTLLERPFRPITLVSTVQVALRARRRQYEVRELLHRQVAATRMRDEFISVASHELKTPLTSLKLQAQLSQRALKAGSGAVDPGMFERLMENTNRQVERLVRLVEDMLDVSRLNTGKLKLEKNEVNLASLVKEIVDRVLPQLAATGNSVTLKLDPEARGVWDAYRIEQVIINLLTNTIRYAPGSRVFVTLRRVGALAVLSVRDEGSGIAPENHEKIFLRFERATTSRNIDGLGLGLYICKQIVENHEGSIRVESDGKSGATFIVELPMLASAALPEGQTSSDQDQDATA